MRQAGRFHQKCPGSIVARSARNRRFKTTRQSLTSDTSRSDDSRYRWAVQAAVCVKTVETPTQKQPNFACEYIWGGCFSVPSSSLHLESHVSDESNTLTAHEGATSLTFSTQHVFFWSCKLRAKRFGFSLFLKLLSRTYLCMLSSH